MQSRNSGLKIHETYVVNISLIYDFFFNKGEDPEAMLIATKIAMEYRQKYAKDVFIEQHCFRRWGHNELDDPTMTNPLLYKQITNRQSVPDAYVETLKDNVDIDNEVVKNHSAMLNDHFKQIETYQVTFLYIAQLLT